MPSIAILSLLSATAHAAVINSEGPNIKALCPQAATSNGEHVGAPGCPVTVGGDTVLPEPSGFTVTPTSGSPVVITPAGLAVTVGTDTVSLGSSGDLHVDSSTTQLPPQPAVNAKASSTPSIIGALSSPQSPTTSGQSSRPTTSATTPIQTPQLTTITTSSVTEVYGYVFLTQYSGLTAPTIISTSYAIDNPSQTISMTTGPIYVGSGGRVVFPENAAASSSTTVPAGWFVNPIRPGGSGGGGGGGGNRKKKCPSYLRLFHLCPDNDYSIDNDRSDVNPDDEDESGNEDPKSSPTSSSSSCTRTSTASACSTSCAPNNGPCSSTCSAVATGCSPTGSSTTTTGDAPASAFDVTWRANIYDTSTYNAVSLASKEIAFLSSDFPDVIPTNGPSLWKCAKDGDHCVCSTTDRGEVQTTGTKLNVPPSQACDYETITPAPTKALPTSSEQPFTTTPITTPGSGLKIDLWGYIHGFAQGYEIYTGPYDTATPSACPRGNPLYTSNANPSAPISRPPTTWSFGGDIGGYQGCVFTMPPGPLTGVLKATPPMSCANQATPAACTVYDGKNLGGTGQCYRVAACAFI